jgi:glycosyltransferase involved in cell wall biosynthesis
LKVLYIQHCGIFGGAPKSLYELISELVKLGVEPTILIQDGDAKSYFTKLTDDIIAIKGIPIFDHNRYSYYRGIRWLVLLREILYFPVAIYAMMRFSKRLGNVDLIHINEINLLPIGVLFKLFFKKPLLVHTRAIQEVVHGRLRIWMFKYLLEKYADSVVAIDENVYDSLVSKKNAIVVHNGLNMQDFVYESPVRQTFNVGFVGNILPSKGLNEIVSAAKYFKNTRRDIRFVVVGARVKKISFLDRVFDFLGLRELSSERLAEEIATNNLDNIEFVEFQKDIRTVYPTIDVLCFPSRLEGVGRPVFEAAFFKIPSIVAISKPMDDTIINGVTGICIKPGKADELISAVEYFYENVDARARMGNNAHRLACKNFDIKKNASEIYKLYKNLTSK